MTSQENKKTILFVTYGAGHVNMVIPVIRALQKTQKYCIKVLGLTVAGQTLQAAKIPYTGFKDYLDESDGEALKWGRKMAQGLSNNTVSKDETIAYLGLSYYDLISRFGETEAAAKFEKSGRQAFLPLTILERVLKKTKPDLVIATNSPRSEQAAILTAGKLGIPSLCLVDLFGLLEIDWLGQKGYADKLCVLSEYVREILVAAGRKPEEIFITGNPAFDQLSTPDLESKAYELRKRKGWNHEKIILWASQVEPKVHPRTGITGDPLLPRKIEEALFSAIEKNPGWRLVIRFHPSESFQYTRLPERVEMSSHSEDLPTLLKSVDSLVTIASTVALEAALLAKPVLTVDMSICTQDAPYSKMGISKGIQTLDELESGLRFLLAGKSSIPSNFPKVGEATTNVVKVIEGLV